MQLLRLIRRSRDAKARSGVGYVRQMVQIMSLARKPNLIGPDEYFEYCLYDPKFSLAERREFVGYKAERFYSKLNLSSWDATANDKVLFEQVMLASGFSSPKNLALFHPWRIANPDCEHIRNVDHLHCFLSGAEFPLFVKPVHGLFGRGTAVIEQYDSDKRALVLSGGQELFLDEFFLWLQSSTREGMLFQRMLIPSQEVVNVCGERLSSVRMIVLCDQDRPSLFRANWKLCTGENVVDNTDGWRNGNIVAAVDHVSGMIQRAYRGLNGTRIEVSEHPDTKTPLIGLRIPHWDEMKTYVESIAKVFPGVRFQAWDIAATSTGICALELNLATFHTVHATQLVSHKGFLDDRLVRVLPDSVWLEDS